MGMDTNFVRVEDLPHAKDLVTDLPYAESELRVKIGEALGAASSCWSNLEGAGVFDSTRCAAINDELVADVIALTGMGRPHLGLATTAELVRELAARTSVAETIGESWPLYRTANSE